MKCPSSVLTTGCLSLLTGRNLPDQAGHNNFPDRYKGSPEFFLITTSEQYSYLWINQGSHLYVHYDMERQKVVAYGLVLEETYIPPFYFLVGHRYFQHAGVGNRNSQALHYHTYFIMGDIQMKYSMVYAYDGNFNKFPEPIPP